MQNKFWQAVEATIISVIVAFFITITLLSGIKLFLGQEIDTFFMLVNKITITTSDNKDVELPVIKKEEKRLEHYPKYGTQYATLQIPQIDLNLPVYFGDSLDILKMGVGHSSGSYFPGEGGSIIFMGHNFVNFFRRFSELQIGNKITVDTVYGTYTYEIYDMKLINETDLDLLPIQKEEEILMIYTCYPFNNVGYTTQRFLVYAKPIEN